MNTFSPSDTTNPGASGSSADFRVIGTGLGRTGTTTLSQCLNVLGFTNQAVDGDWYWTRFEGDDLVFNADRTQGDAFRAWTDSPVPLVYRELADLYPGSRVVMTVRPIDAWLRSIERLVAWSAEHYTDPADDRRLRAYRRQTYGAETFDRARYAASFEAHREAVPRFFAGRDEPYLALDLTQDPGWERLCEFLGQPVPDEPFPWRNRVRAKGGARRAWDHARWRVRRLARTGRRPA